MAVRRHFYSKQWYKKNESTFTQAMSIRGQNLLIGEPQMPAEDFVHNVFPRRVWDKHTTALVEIVEAVDRRHQCRSLSQ